jgi:Flp pilus assembly protein TadG
VKRKWQGRRSQRRGHVAVEFGIVVPIFLVFVFGLIEVGRGFNATHLLNNAARSACRQGILQNQTNDTITSKVNSILSAQSITGTTTSITVNGNTANASTAVSGDDLSVKVTVPVATITWIPGMQYLSGNLTGQYSLRKE